MSRTPPPRPPDSQRSTVSTHCLSHLIRHHATATVSISKHPAASSQRLPRLPDYRKQRLDGSAPSGVGKRPPSARGGKHPDKNCPVVVPAVRPGMAGSRTAPAPITESEVQNPVPTHPTILARGFEFYRVTTLSSVSNNFSTSSH